MNNKKFMNNILSKLFTLGLSAVAIYFFYRYNFFLAVIFLIWSLSRLFGYNFQRLINGFRETNTYSQLEKKCNVEIQVKINIEEVLKHKAVSELFDRLPDHLKKKNKKEWLEKLLHNYKKKFDK